MMSTYIREVAALPTPTAQQTRNFAEFVTSAHSWYKHLRISRASPFVFFLDPNAGRSLVHLSETEVQFVDNGETDSGLHYTWQTTKSYRERFGCWNYDAPYGRSLLYQAGAGLVDTGGAGLFILSADGEWLPVPESPMRAGTAELTGLMWYPYHRDGGSIGSLIEQEMRIACIFRIRLPFREAEEARSRKQLDALMDALMPVLPQDMAAALRSLFVLWADQTYQSEVAQTHRAIDALYDKAAASDRPWDETMKAGGGDLLWRQAKEAWDASASRQKEVLLLEPLIAALDRERERQIEAMVQAMNRFSATIDRDASC
jgi:hypothetical protein